MTQPIAEAIAAFSTALSPRYLGFAVLVIAGIAMARKVTPWKALYVPSVFLIAQTITTVLKYTIDRERPPLEFQLVYTYDPSFPSGHATAAFSIATAIVIMLLTKSWTPRLPGLIGLVAVVGASASAASRLYLNVHWPTDVIAGAGIGITTAIVLWGIGRYVYRRGGALR